MIAIDARLMRAMYVLYLIAWSITDMCGYAGSWVKYIFLTGYIGTGLLILRVQYVRGRRDYDTYLLRQVMICCVVWAFVSVIAVLFNGFHGPYLKDLLYIAVPAFFVFAKVNADPDAGLDFYFGLQIIALLASFLVINRDKLTIEMLLAVRFADSLSPFEHPSSNTWSLLFLYHYVEKKRFRMLLCAVMCCLTLKRINVAFVLLMLLAGRPLRKLRATDTLIHLCVAVFILSPLLFSLFLSEPFILWFDNTFQKSFYEFTMGRSEQFLFARSLPESKLGLGMTTRLLERYGYPVTIFHSDILRIYWETTFAGLGAFVITFFNLVKINRSIYFLAAMAMTFLTLFVTVNLASTESWLLLFLYAYYLGKKESKNHMVPDTG